MRSHHKTRRSAQCVLGAAIAALTISSVSAQDATPPSVDVASPVVQEVTDFDTYTGRFQAIEDVDLRAQISGTVNEISFVEGAIVAANDPLFVLDDRRAIAEVARLQARVAEAESIRDLATIEFERAEALRARQANTVQDVDQRRAERDAAQAVLEATQAQLSTAQIELNDTVVRAPFTGRIGAALVDEGALIDGGSGQGTVLASLVSVDPVEIVFDGSESDYLAYVRLDLSGQAGSSRRDPAEVRIRLPDEDDWTHTGRINFIDNRLDPNAGTIRVRAEVPNPDELFAPGLFAEVRVPRFGPYEAILVPDAAILSDQAGRIVYIVDEAGMVNVRPITTGQRVGTLRVIRSGLDAADTVVVGGLMSVQPGVMIEPNHVELTGIAQAPVAEQ